MVTVMNLMTHTHTHSHTDQIDVGCHYGCSDEIDVELDETVVLQDLII
jgi:hypothetical protein